MAVVGPVAGALRMRSAVISVHADPGARPNVRADRAARMGAEVPAECVLGARTATLKAHVSSRAPRTPRSRRRMPRVPKAPIGTVWSGSASRMTELTWRSTATRAATAAVAVRPAHRRGSSCGSPSSPGARASQGTVRPPEAPRPTRPCRTRPAGHTPRGSTPRRRSLGSDRGSRTPRRRGCGTRRRRWCRVRRPDDERRRRRRMTG